MAEQVRERPKRSPTFSPRAADMSGPAAMVRMVRGYRPRQLAARAVNRARRRLPLALGRDRLPPEIDREVLANLSEYARERFARAVDPAELLGGRITMLGRTEDVVPDAIWGVRPDTRSDLWNFHLHYHEFVVPLLASGPDGHRLAWDLIKGWLESCPPANQALLASWHPYVISCRIMPWTVALASQPDEPLARSLARSLWRQLRVLAHHVEHDVGGNHLVRNAKALAVGGALFRGPEADSMRLQGLRLMERSLADQLGADGGHIEGSPAYHALVLEDTFDSLLAAPSSDLVGVREHASRALTWIEAISPVGAPRPHLNDSQDFGVPSTEDLLRHAERVGVRATKLPASSMTPRYVVMGDEKMRVLFDAGQPCRPDLPYHSHADSLGILIDVEGQRVVPDRGVATYAAGPERAWWRSTAAHSTVEVGGENSSEMIGAFRAGRLSRTTLERDEPNDVIAGHDGAGRRLHAHCRRVQRQGDRSWCVTDMTPASKDSVWRLHLAPGAEVEVGSAGARVRVGSLRLDVNVAGLDQIAVEQTPHAVAMGRTVAAATLVARARASRIDATIEVV